MATRRSHKKSRNGCEQCKQRRVKCDEDIPCANCSRRGMECSYENRSSSTPRGRQNDVGTAPNTQRSRRACSSPRPPSEDPFGLLAQRISEGSFIPHEWTAQDAELMHHFTLYASKTFARRPEMQETWQVAIPKIAYSNEFLMHGILALSALHLAHLKPERYSTYLAGSGFHMSLGLRSFRRILVSPTSDNCCALFAFCSIVMVYIHASPAEPPDSLFNSSNGLNSILELLTLCRGTLVLHPYISVIQSSALKPLFMREFEMHIEHPDTDHPSSHLRHLIDAEIPIDQQGTFTQALEMLVHSFKTISTAERPLECGMLYMWPLSVEDSFFGALRQHHPVALVFLAYYCVQLQAFSDFWFVGERGVVWFKEIENALDGKFAEWLEWPRGAVTR
ncbi:hypothetical protein BJY04DRAFT_229107 [Aspergillus karnatakaensis]|uniref:Zn(II)2Cys6 transcription factor n=1 Tax=Aspergillus karnatakaensis TaxID=1810916 RepID=UPI003CCCC85C